MRLAWPRIVEDDTSTTTGSAARGVGVGGEDEADEEEG